MTTATLAASASIPKRAIAQDVQPSTTYRAWSHCAASRSSKPGSFSGKVSTDFN